jgi:predicted MFS family arabinose efflux permease
MWLAKPVYEALPYYYVGIGVAALAARLYVDWWYWPAICTAVGVLGIAGGVLVWLKRRGSRRSQ